MCLVAIMYRVVEGVPLVLAANREEAYARGGTPLDIRDGPRPFIAGLDPTAGGTWLGLNATGLIVAVTNRPKQDRPAQPRSRGLLVRDLLAFDSAREAAQVASRELGKGPYAGCNIICADTDSLWVVQAGDWLRVRSLSPGYHIITSGDVNDALDDRAYWVMERLHDRPPVDRATAIEMSKFICAHAEPPTPICLHGGEGGTVSSTIIAIAEHSRDSRLLHAQGPPDRTNYSDRTDLWWEMRQRVDRGQA